MKPQIDHYIGQPVDSIEQGDEAWDWALHFETGVLLRNHDKKRTKAPEVQGQVFLGVAMSTNDTRLQFGHYVGHGDPVIDQEITLTPTEYSIADERYEAGPYYPQRPDVEEELLPADPSDERIADGSDWMREARMEAAQSAAEAMEEAE